MRSPRIRRQLGSGRRRSPALSSAVMASTWGSIGKKLGDFAVTQGPKLLRQVQNTPAVKRATAALAGPPSGVPGRPVSRRTSPTAHRARRESSTPPISTAAPIPARSSGRGSRTRRIPAKARTGRCWSSAGTATRCGADALVEQRARRRAELAGARHRPWDADSSRVGCDSTGSSTFPRRHPTGGRRTRRRSFRDGGRPPTRDYSWH